MSGLCLKIDQISCFGCRSEQVRQETLLQTYPMCVCNYLVCVCVAPGAVRQRGPQGKGVPKDHPAPRLWKTTGPPSLHPQTDQQHLPQVQAAFRLRQCTGFQGAIFSFFNAMESNVSQQRPSAGRADVFMNLPTGTNDDFCSTKRELKQQSGCVFIFIKRCPKLLSSQATRMRT